MHLRGIVVALPEIVRRVEGLFALAEQLGVRLAKAPLLFENPGRQRSRRVLWNARTWTRFKATGSPGTTPRFA